MTDSSKAQWTPIAHLLRPQGRRGELLAEPLSTLESLFSSGSSVRLGAGDANTPSEKSTIHTIEEHWFPTGRQAGRIVLKLSGCNTISDAESLAGQRVFIPSTELPKLDEDTFFIGDLLDCELYNGETLVGKVTDVQFPTSPDGRSRLEDAAPLLAVTPGTQDSEEPLLIPFVKAWLESIDVAGKRIIMHLPEGLLDTPGSEVEPPLGDSESGLP